MLVVENPDNDEKIASAYNPEVTTLNILVYCFLLNYIFNLTQGHTVGSIVCSLFFFF